MLRFISAGARRVVVSRPVKGSVPNVVYGVNDSVLTGDEPVVTAASCTTNCIAPLFKVMIERFGVGACYVNYYSQCNGNTKCC